MDDTGVVVVTNTTLAMVLVTGRRSRRRVVVVVVDTMLMISSHLGGCRGTNSNRSACAIPLVWIGRRRSRIRGNSSSSAIT
jgi:hypothetical protein